jgi:hypothetical protein
VQFDASDAQYRAFVVWVTYVFEEAPAIAGDAKTVAMPIPAMIEP